MFQESVDRAHGSAKSDLLLFAVLIVSFFAVGALVFYLEGVFASSVPRYVFIALALAALYLIYRLRLTGYRYTVFYKAPEPVYDPRFDDMMLHEDYPYPVGTVVFERISSAKGAILLAIDRSELLAFSAPGEACPYENVETVLDASCKKSSLAHSLYFKREGSVKRVLFAPGEELSGYVRALIEEGEA